MFKYKFPKPAIIVIRKKYNYFFTKRNKAIKLARILLNCPQKKVIVRKIRITTPRKPNSARRKTIKGLYKFGKVVQSYIPGGNHQLKQYSQILVNGRGPRDLPGIYSAGIRGKIDLKPIKKVNRRSLYGIKKKEE